MLGAGMIAPVIYIAGDILASARYEDYSYVDHTISELNAVGAPTRPLTIAVGLVVYALLIAFGAGIWSAAADRRLRVSGAVLVGLGVLSLWAVPFASMRVRGAEQDPTHVMAGGVAVVLLVIAMAFAAAALGPRFRYYTIATILVMLGFGAWTAVDGPRVAEGLDTPWLGVKERISFYSYNLWFLLLALALLRGRAGGAAGDRVRAAALPTERATTA